MGNKVELENGLFVKDDKVLVSSVEVALLFNKQHCNIMKRIRTIIEKTPRLKKHFIQDTYNTTSRKGNTMLLMDKKGFEAVTSKYNSVKELQAKIKCLASMEAVVIEPTPVTIIENTSVGTIVVPNNTMPTVIVEPTVVIEQPEVIEHPKAELVVIETVQPIESQKQHNDMSDELIKTQVNENNEIIVSGRELHEFLEVVTPFHKWIVRMIEYGFVENEDFLVMDIFVPNSKGGKQSQKDYALKLDMAKEISMIQRNEKGKQARQYFIETEKKYKAQSQTPAIPMASYMIDDKLQRAKLWIQEEEERLLLAETVETQQKVIECKEEIIEKQTQIINEQEQELVKATATISNQREAIYESINEKHARASEMSRGYSAREMREQITHMVFTNSGYDTKGGWNKLYNSYNAKYGVNLNEMKKKYERLNKTNLKIIEFAEKNIVIISQLYDTALEVFGKKGMFERYYR